MTGFGRRSSALGVQSRALRLVRTHEHLCGITVFAFGQVDVELGLYYRWLFKDAKIDALAFFEEIIDIYIRNITEIASSARPIIKGINQTVLVDQNRAVAYVSRIISENSATPTQAKELAKTLATLYPEIQRRLELTTQFNQILRDYAKKYDLTYFNLNQHLIDPKTRRVKEIHSPADHDHHIVDSIDIRKLHLAMLLKALKT